MTGVDDYPDQVVRKEKFLAEHPEWQASVIRPEGRPLYHQFRRLNGAQEAVLTDPSLERVLDRVEALVELEAEPAAGAKQPAS
ncbi:MAG: hypothetical protein JOY82_07695 [Streptosporangiaceae bacterium]|nr:hypothetical protein [Streptosporangiaceae bacterium]